MFLGSTAAVAAAPSLRPRRCRGLGSLLAAAVFGLLAAAASASAAHAAPPKPLLVDVFFDLSEDSFTEPGAAEGAAAPGDIRIAGIPVRLGDHDGTPAAGWRTITGARGRYASPIAGDLGMTTTVRFSKTNFAAENAPGKAAASAATDLRYASGGWTLAVQPGVEIARWETDTVNRESTIEGRVSKALGGGISVTTGGRYRWREAAEGQKTDSQITFGRFGLACQLPHRIGMDMAYVVRQEAATDLIRGGGPSIAITLPLGETVDLAADYDLTETTRYAAAEVDPDGERRNRHHLRLGMSWDVGGYSSDMRLSAAYRYEQVSARAGQADTARHAGTANFALNF